MRWKSEIIFEGLKIYFEKLSYSFFSPSTSQFYVWQSISYRQSWFFSTLSLFLCRKVIFTRSYFSLDLVFVFYFTLRLSELAWEKLALREIEIDEKNLEKLASFFLYIIVFSIWNKTKKNVMFFAFSVYALPSLYILRINI